MLYKQKRARIEKRTKMDIEAEIKSRVRIEEMERSKVRKEIEGRKYHKQIHHPDNSCDVWTSS